MASSPDLTFATRLRRHETVVGTVVTLPDIALAELTAEALDFVWIDLEHGCLGIAEIQPLAVAARAAGSAAIVRLPGLDHPRISAILDAGVDGVAVPRVESADDARRIVKRLHYPPGGTRGYAARRASGYGATGTAAAVVVMAQIETRAGLDAAAEIASVPGVDALVVGCSDLALELRGELGARSRAVREAIAHVQAAARPAGVASGVAGPDDPALLQELAGDRASVLVCSADVRTYARAARDQAAALRRVVPVEEGTRVGA
jgi:4-hydroxy-2-oxoheptanedioate aldolase